MQCYLKANLEEKAIRNFQPHIGLRNHFLFTHPLLASGLATPRPLQHVTRSIQIKVIKENVK